MFKDAIRSLFSARNKTLLISLLIMIILCFVVSGTLMYLLDYGNVKNTFEPSKVTSYVVEELNGNVKENVKIKNTGDTDAYIRATIVVNWKDEAGNIYGEFEPVASTATETNDYTLVLQEYDELDETKWIQGSDGFYYWTKPVAPNETTGTLIESCEYTANAPEGYHLSVEILGSAIQSRGKIDDGKYIIEDAWPAVQVNDDTKLLELKPAGN